MKLALIITVVVAAMAVTTPAAMALCDYFNFTLEAQQVVPPPQDVVGSGWSELHLCSDDTLRGYVSINLTEVVTGVQIHGPAEIDANGSVLFELPLPSGGTVPVLLGGVLQYREFFILNKCYADVHTTAHPDGAIRGVIHPEVAVAPAVWGRVKELYR